MGLLSAIRQKAAGLVRFPGRSMIYFDQGRLTTDELARTVGDGTDADVLMSPVRWLQRNINDAPWQLLDAAGEPVESSELLTLLNDRPNPYYSGDVLLAGTVLSLCLAGNAYWIVARNDVGRPVEIWFAPHTAVTPRSPGASDASKFISHYRYRIAGGQQNIAPMGAPAENAPANAVEGLAMVHFREGVDLRDMRLGMSPIRGLLREIWTDQEAASFTAALLRNGGIPGVIVSPSDNGELLTPEQAKIAQERLRTEYTGEGRGKPMVWLGPAKVEQFGFSPKELDLSPLRDVSEERVCAALGVPAAVVGFGAGLQQTRVGATMRELRVLAWSGGVIPLQRRIAGEVTRAIVPEFPEVQAAKFDNSEVEALRENQDTRATRIERLVRAGVLTRGEARAELGFEAAAGDDVYLLSLATIEVPRNGASNGAGVLERSALPQLALSAGVKETTEERIIERAPRAEPLPVVQQVARRLDTIRRATAEVFQARLEEIFQTLGQSAARAVVELGVQFNDLEGSIKQDWLTDVLAATDITAATAAMEDLYGELYMSSAAGAGSALAEVLGIEFVIDDSVQRTVLREGGLRVGLVDLDQQTREAIFEGLAEARAEGLTADNLARRIRDRVTAGPWRDAATRARVIARTEGAHAANTATLTAARSMRATNHVQVFDNRTGHNDEICSAADGIVVTIDEGQAMGLSHPNCTRAFVPINSVLLEEMGIDP